MTTPTNALVSRDGLRFAKPGEPFRAAFTIAVSIGYIFNMRPTTKPVPISVATVATIVTTLTSVNAAMSLSHGVIATPIANSSG